MLTARERLPLGAIMAHGWWPSALKKLYYRAKGYRIGRGVSFGFGSVVVGDEVSIGAEARVGMLTIVRGRKVTIGSRVHIGMMTILDTYEIEVGEGTRINNQVIVGGMQTPHSRFCMGRNGILMEWSFVNTTMPVVIGDEVGIGGHCLFFTHGLWPNALEGFPVNYGPITIEDGAWLAWRVTVLPGVNIGAQAIVSSDACVTKPLPALSLAAGVPAKVLRENGTFLAPKDHETNKKRLLKLLQDFSEWLTFHGVAVDRSAETFLEARRNGEVFGLQINFEGQIKPNSGILKNCLLSLSEIAAEQRRALDASGVPWLDLALRERSLQSNHMADEIEDFLRRIGVRFLKYSRRAL